MSDYIKREDALECVTYDEEYTTEQIKGLPSADVVPVVRCRDCKHVYCRIYHGWQEPIYTCTHLRSRWNTDNDLEVNPDDFCSYGEKGKQE